MGAAAIGPRRPKRRRRHPRPSGATSTFVTLVVEPEACYRQWPAEPARASPAGPTMITPRTQERLDDEAGDDPAGDGAGPQAGAAIPAAQGDATATAPRIVFCGVTGRRDLAQRASAASPGTRFVWRRSWSDDPGEGRGAGRRSRRSTPVGMWLWSGSDDELRARANEVLLRFVHPLMGRGLPYCIGFPFAANVFARRPLGPADISALDLEDIGALLGVRDALGTSGQTGLRRAARARRGAPAVASSGAPRGASAPAPDAVRLDAAQRAAVEHGRGPARVLAPAGSGKTKTLVSRVAELVSRGEDPGSILLLAFNRKAAEQLEERLAAHGIATTRRLGAERGRRPAAVHCGTFNAFGYRYQREVVVARVALDTRGSGLRALMRQAMDAAGASPAALRPARDSDPVGAFLEALTKVRAGLEAPENVEVRISSVGDQPVVIVPFSEVHARYTRAQAVTGCQSFDDQIYLAVVDMLADPDHRAYIEGRFDHVLVDEFQDLNGAQLALVDILSRPRRDLFVVGDDDQLIYGWRSADPRGILEFHARMPPRPWSATYTLCTNYRCSRVVVESAARLVAHNTVREDKDVRPREGAAEGALHFAGAPTWPARAAALCTFLRAENSRLGCAWRDLAVLCRYRSQQLAVALALDADDIPRTPALAFKLFSHPGACLLRAYIDLVGAPHAMSGERLRGLLNRPNRYLRNAVVEAVAAAPRPWMHLRALAAAEPESGPRPLSLLVEGAGALAPAPRSVAYAGMHSSASVPALTAGELVWAVVDQFGLEDYWDGAAHEPDGPQDEAGALQVLDALLVLAETYPDPTVYLAVWDRLLADELAHEGTADDSLAREEAEEDRVVIGTIHAAKGREYAAVAIPDYDCDVTRWEAAEIEEERRVVYVGVTRARDSALLTVDTSRPYVHPFLRELVERPEPDEHEALTAWLQAEESPDLRARIAARIVEVETLFPEM
jgi:DNA helicase II / ATP-dependent DNA helicase PcrA